MRIPFYIAANKNSLSSLPGVEYHPAYSLPDIGYDTLTIDGYRFLIDVVVANISGGLDLLLLLPEQDTPEESLKIFRRVNKIGRTCLSIKEGEEPKAQLLGPYTQGNLTEAFPKANLSCLLNEAGEHRCPHVFAGDPAPEDMAKVFYKPSDADCDTDVKAELTKVFAKLAPKEVIEDEPIIKEK